MSVIGLKAIAMTDHDTVPVSAPASGHCHPSACGTFYNLTILAPDVKAFMGLHIFTSKWIFTMPIAGSYHAKMRISHRRKSYIIDHLVQMGIVKFTSLLSRQNFCALFTAYIRNNLTDTPCFKVFIDGK